METRGIEALDVEVLDVGVPPRPPPADLIVVADHDAGPPRRSSAGDVPAGSAQVDQVPARGMREPPMRIDGAERRARPGARGADGPRRVPLQPVLPRRRLRRRVGGTGPPNLRWNRRGEAGEER